ncbi:MAG: hypothetical protein P8P98_02475 [Emcibacteraceae bacterium]|nr:hypothetical protein [Emcibacteraceae bacterium]MDG1996220.1 hypothetical protein [Emcibacteraceae bacterium]
MNIFFRISVLCIVLMISACGGPSRFVTEYIPMDSSNTENTAYLSDNGEKPRLIISNFFDDDLKIFTDQNYVVVGKSEFSGPLENMNDAVAKGVELQVTHVLLEQKYAYSGSKKAYKYASTYNYTPAYKTINNYTYVRYERMPDLISIPYSKEVAVFKQRAVYLAKLKQ